jgi:hypothetical protein
MSGRSQAGPRHACHGWGVEGVRPSCKSAIVVCNYDRLIARHRMYSWYEVAALEFTAAATPDQKKG